MLSYNLLTSCKQFRIRILQIPKEIIILVAQYLNADDFLNFALAAHHLYIPLYLSTDKNLVKIAAKKDNPSFCVKFLSVNKNICLEPSLREIVVWAASGGYVVLLKELMNTFVYNPILEKSAALKSASQFGHASIVDWLLQEIDIQSVLAESFCLACKNGHIQIVRRFLGEPKVLILDNIKHLLVVAAEKGHLTIIKLLLQNLQDLDWGSTYGFALWFSVLNGHHFVLKKLLELPSAHLFGNSLIKVAVENYCTESIKVLMQDDRLELPQNQLEDLVKFSLKNNYTVGVDLLLQRNHLTSAKLKELFLLNMEDGEFGSLERILKEPGFCAMLDGSKILISAARYGKEEIVKKLLAIKEIDASLHDNLAINRACLYKNIVVVMLLLEDERVKRRLDFSVLANLASEIGSLPILELILNYQNAKFSSGIYHPLIQAVVNGHSEIVKRLLLDIRFDPSELNNLAVIEASKRGFYDILTYLIHDKRVDPSAQKNIVFIESCRRGYGPVVDILLKDNRVDPSDQDNLALIEASSEGNYNIVEKLLKDKRVDINAQNNLALYKARMLKKNSFNDILELKNLPTSMCKCKNSARIINLFLDLSDTDGSDCEL
ncbi:hypothetical protein HK099_004246 [Clydaea vesicula]|uniref:Ankyrin repeat protein n=1 Tax=Clydaea vesicula TaxID=447962 RepID=A0AAD5U596_9FUNG|nr:hypothetical protein HK099_004246 [Clydaea vesicula]